MTDNTIKGRVAVGMSGGVDSSVVAALLVEQGYEVIGITAHMWKDGSRCCSLEDVEHARRVCVYLGIRHVVVNAQEVFTQRVVNPFVEEYVSGRTPSPCIHCNVFVKFGFLLERVRQLDCRYLATGHYARVTESDGRYHLFCAQDPSKDQAYFLHRLNQKQLAHIRFPLAEWSKQQVKAYAVQCGFPVTPRGESQDLCFVVDGGVPDFVEERRPTIAKEGEIRGPDGRVLGTHGGLHRYTVGQRSGLGIATGERMYVRRLDTVRNEVEMAPRADVMNRICTVLDLQWISGEAPVETLRCEVRPRYRSSGATATIRLLDQKAAEIIFDEPQFALTPGQAAVFYQEGEVLGGGWIDTVR